MGLYLENCLENNLSANFFPSYATLVWSKVTSGEIDRDWANCVKCDSKRKLFALEPDSFIERLFQDFGVLTVMLKPSLIFERKMSTISWDCLLV